MKKEGREIRGPPEKDTISSDCVSCVSQKDMYNTSAV